MIFRIAARSNGLFYDAHKKRNFRDEHGPDLHSSNDQLFDDACAARRRQGRRAAVLDEIAHGQQHQHRDLVAVAWAIATMLKTR